MNILLAYPEYPNTFWSFRHALSFIRKKAAFPPLGLLTVASLLPAEWNVRLVDMNVQTIRDADFKWADMVFVSAMIVQKDSAQEILDRAKMHGKRTVVGGPFFTSCDKKSVRGADHFVLNEAEITLPEFLRDFNCGNPKSEYTSANKPNLNITPLPRWDLINFRHYATMPIQYTRGCPYNCEFCDITILYGRKTRLKETSQFIAEVEALYRAGWRDSVFIVDDNFVGNIVRVKEMLPHLVVWQTTHGYPFSFFTEASVNLAKDPTLLCLLRDAGFTKVFLGIETPRRDGLIACKKGQNVNVNLAEAVRTVHSYGIEVLAGFIVGFDTDDPAVFDDQITFIQTTGIVNAMVGLLSALPKTA
ncbi:MAG: radical SAM protein, partial [bacterium]|nr:radical SAM protein [bacterium]